VPGVEHWSLDFFVIEYSGKALCHVCNETLAALKDKTFDGITILNVHGQVHSGELPADELRTMKRFLSSQDTP
jgi:uncharacterized protein YuzB (UPF0349 family)